jgi:hypothetical protein
LFSPSTVNKWIPYHNDDAPTKNGVSAGGIDCNHTVYVGKGKTSGGVFLPGRIQTFSPIGFYTLNYNIETYFQNGSYYLEDNPNYTYYWVPFISLPHIERRVKVYDDVGNYATTVSRLSVDGVTNVGRVGYIAGILPDEDGVGTIYRSFELLVCDPWPRYQCGQDWKAFNASDPSAPTRDGYGPNSTLFVGLACDVNVARIQVSAPAGGYYLDPLSASEAFDNETAKYLVKNPNNTYKWANTRNGVQVPNALAVHVEGHQPFYIGSVNINNEVFIGKVRPGEGLVFVGPKGKQKTSSSYSVLTCYSPDASNGFYEEDSDEDWYGEHWCPRRKYWNLDQEKCVCHNEYRSNPKKNGVWDEDSCSYV